MHPISTTMWSLGICINGLFTVSEELSSEMTYHTDLYIVFTVGPTLKYNHLLDHSPFTFGISKVFVIGDY